MRSIILCFCFFGMIISAEDLPTLRVVTWSYYIETDPQADEQLTTVERSPMLQEFMKEFGCRIDYIELDNEEEIVSYVLGNLDSVDITIDATEHLAARNGSLTWMPIPPDFPIQADQLRPEVRKLLVALNTRNRVPFLAGTTGIVYRKDLTDEPISWAQLFTNEKSACLDSPNTAFIADFRRRQVDFSAVNDQEVITAARSLRDWFASGHVVSVTADLDHIEEQLVAGEINMALMWSGDALRMRADHPEVPIGYRIPDEGSDFYTEGWLVNPRSRHTDLAWSFAAFLLRPEIQVRLCKSLHYQVTTQAALDLLRTDFPDLANDPGVEPPPEILERCDDSNILEKFDLLGPWNRACESATQALKDR